MKSRRPGPGSDLPSEALVHHLQVGSQQNPSPTVTWRAARAGPAEHSVPAGHLWQTQRGGPWPLDCLLPAFSHQGVAFSSVFLSQSFIYASKANV